MKYFIGFLLFTALLSGFSSCSTSSISKPEKLIPKDKFEKMMIDMYIIQGFTGVVSSDSIMSKINQTDLYYSILNKYSISDTVFIKSLIYYSSFPKDYEKMHLQIMDQLNESQQQFRPKDALQVDTE